jgi:hypothetical protein
MSNPIDIVAATAASASGRAQNRPLESTAGAPATTVPPWGARPQSEQNWAPIGFTV